MAGPEDLRGLADVERGAIVELERATPGLKASDRTIWEIAQENDLTYSAALHRQARPTDRANYIEMHERRLEALRRDGVVSRERDGTFYLPHDYPTQVAMREPLTMRLHGMPIAASPAEAATPGMTRSDALGGT